MLLAATLVPMAVRAERERPAAQPLPTLTAGPATPVTVFIGDSSVKGSGATRAKGRWSTMASQSLRWHEVNLARTGSGYAPTNGSGGCDGRATCHRYADDIAAVKLQNPQVVVVGGGHPPSGSAGTSTTAVKNFYRDLHAALPDARIIAVGPWTGSKPDKSLLALDAAVQSSARSVRGVYVSLLAPPMIDAAMTTDGGRALNDVGHQSVADRVTKTINDDSSEGN